MSAGQAARMRQVNFAVTVLVVLAMLAALTLLGWLRRQTQGDLDRDVSDLAASLSPDLILHGPGGDSLVRYQQAESLIQRGLQSPYIRSVVLSLTLPGRPETVVVPFGFAAEHPGDPLQALGGYEARALGTPEAPWGKLYLKLDRTIVLRINVAIGAVALAILLMLATLLARLWSQHGSLTRTVIELDERRRELIRVERLALAGQLSAGILHDLRKPVLNIRHNVEELREALGDFAPAAASLDELQRHVRLFFEILGESQVERFVRSDKAGEEYVDLAQALDYSFNLVRYEQRGVQVERLLEPGLPPIYAQPFRLIQLFSNLILNAYQALEGRGRLRVEAAVKAGGVQARLTDDGPGIAPEDQARVFDPFFTTKAEGEGSGLGLSICRLIVQEAGGRIAVESRVGGPTTFVVWFPAEPIAAKEPGP
jgi:signal transduction histidine kinase